MAKKRSISSKTWLARQHDDPYVKQARELGLRSRAAIKLMQLQQKQALFQPGMRVLDFGAAPGGWSQLIKKWIGSKGQIVACDLLPMEPIEGVTFIIGDGTLPEVQAMMLKAMDEQQADCLVSDMAPNFSGHRQADQLKAIGLLEDLYACLPVLLKPEGTVILKIFHGVGFDAYLKQARKDFKRIIMIKPDASRKESREVYLLAYGFKGKIQR
jgi:23S rRNA (uridine2552-2'-O)-methyltransferase